MPTLWRVVVSLAVAVLVACGGSSSSGGGGGGGGTTYSLGGSLSGLAASGLVLSSTGEPDLTVSAGATTFVFATKLADGAPYAVGVAAQPPGETCGVTGGTGTVSGANVTGVVVTCTPSWAAVSVAGSHTLARTTDGALWAWGENGLGELGVGDQVPHHVPTLVGFAFEKVATGMFHTASVRTSTSSLIVYHEVWTWGDDSTGQLGNGATSTSATLTPIYLSRGWVLVAAGDWHTEAVKPDGTLWSWGDNPAGQLGDGTTTQSSSPVQTAVGSALNHVISVAAGGLHGAAVTADGGLWTWGDNTYFQLGDSSPSQRPAPAQVYTGYALVAAGEHHTAAVKADGTLWTFGDNTYGQLGNGGVVGGPTPQSTGVGSLSNPVVSVAAGQRHTLAVTQDGKLWAFGDNSYGQLGDGTTYQRYSPVLVGSGYASVAAAERHSAAVKLDGTLWTWGDNSNGELGDGTTTPSTIPIEIP